MTVAEVVAPVDSVLVGLAVDDTLMLPVALVLMLRVLVGVALGSELAGTRFGSYGVNATP